MTPQIAAGSIAAPQFRNEVRVPDASRPQRRSGFWMAMKLRLAKDGSSVELAQSRNFA